jgi:ribonuclease E
LVEVDGVENADSAERRRRRRRRGGRRDRVNGDRGATPEENEDGTAQAMPDADAQAPVAEGALSGTERASGADTNRAGESAERPARTSRPRRVAERTESGSNEAAPASPLQASAAAASSPRGDEQQAAFQDGTMPAPIDSPALDRDATSGAQPVSAFEAPTASMQTVEAPASPTAVVEPRATQVAQEAGSGTPTEEPAPLNLGEPSTATPVIAPAAQVTDRVDGATAVASTAIAIPAPAPAKAASPATPDQTPEEPASLTKIVESAGLEWVQTRQDLGATATQVEAPVARAPRAPRVRKPRVATASEPLMQVETQPDAKESDAP